MAARTSSRSEKSADKGNNSYGGELRGSQETDDSSFQKITSSGKPKQNQVQRYIDRDLRFSRGANLRQSTLSGPSPKTVPTVQRYIDRDLRFSRGANLRQSTLSGPSPKTVPTVSRDIDRDFRFSRRADLTQPTIGGPSPRTALTMSRDRECRFSRGANLTQPSGPSPKTVPTKRLHFVSLGCLALAAALCVTLIYTFVIRQNEHKDKTLPNVFVLDLKTNISANLPIPSDVLEDATSLTITPPDGKTIHVDIKNERKRRQLETKPSWTISLLEPGTIGITGPRASCLSDGTYNITVMNGYKALYEISFTIQINNNPSLSGALSRTDEGRKHFHCEMNSACVRSPLDVSGNGGPDSTGALLDVPRECSSMYSIEDGFRYECSGVTDYSALSCMSLTTPENAEPGSTTSFVISECARGPCLHGGTCEVFGMANDYTCTCKPGYQGHDCEIDIDDCESNPCKNGATCKDLVNDFQCECSPGYEGKTCIIDINECVSRPCKHGGTCVDGQDSYSCQCKSGYTGSHCELDINECMSSPCQNIGTCYDGTNDYTCICRSGFTGINCETALPECLSGPCSNAATCRDTDAGFACDCPYGYTGRTCDTEINFCQDDPCRMGTCTNSPNGYSCACVEGYIGSQCQTALPGVGCDAEQDMACVEHARCDGDSAVCKCTDPYITAEDGTQCIYGCGQTCSPWESEDDVYSVSGPVCGSTFKRCVITNGTSALYTQQCQDNDVFDPVSCVCVPVSDASWCKPGVAENELESKCLSGCRDLNE